MNTVLIQDGQPTVLPGRLIRRRSAFGNLLRKECLESRDALIAGVVIFWLGPALLELLYLALDRNHETFPIAWGLLMLTGWLYAVIVGAHTVCRDWGKPEEHFLLAQPVSPRAVVGAKLVAGAALLAGVLLIVMAWEAMLAWWGAFGPGTKPIPENAYEWHQFWSTMIPMVIIIAVAYGLAFAVAVMTRQMLASTMVATLAVVVWAIAPLLSSRLTFLCAPIFLQEATGATINLPFALVSTLGLVACAATSFLCSTRERVLRLGHKQLAWTIALVMLALFGLAMTEVGSSLTVRDQTQLIDSDPWYLGRTRAVERGDRFFFITDNGPTQTWEIASFRVADNGRIQGLRRAEVPGTRPSGDLRERQRLTGFAFDESGYLVVSGVRERALTKGPFDRLESSWRATLSWGDRGEPEVLSHAELKLPTGKHLAWLEGYRENASTSRYTYVASVVGEDRAEHKDRLYVFDWSDGLNPAPRFEVVLPPEAGGVYVSRGEVRVWARQMNPSDKGSREAAFDANHPELLLDKQNWNFHVPNYRRDWGQFERPGGDDISFDTVDVHGQFVYLSDRLGLRVAQRTPAGHWEIIGGCRASPLAMLSRLDLVPKAFDGSLLIERSSSRLTVYDVSVPARPRRVGFFNGVVPWEDDAMLITQRHLVLREFNLITVLDRPDQRGKNNP